ncbi:MAG: ROK family protein [Aeromicrobium sp.]|uniref:ROK family transcriptional regulator n=1 Tax=Aeromicrobium sp. TaxID=1871063 RepID=UPI002627CEAD|nr:ROK family transcriptional regulator [Aeromicrobium sp.]MDF1704199.1 ROK family protein [Aeromicrobium sp.]
MVEPGATPWSAPAPVAVRQSSLRERNLAAIVAAVCRAEVPPSRADLAAELSMTRATAGRLVDELVAARVVDEVDRSQGARGRPAKGLLPGTGIVGLGLAVETDRLLVRAVDLRGRVVGERVVSSSAGDAESVLDALAHQAREVRRGLQGRRLVGVGVALPGIVDDDGRLLRAPNLRWNDVDVAGILASVGGRHRVLVANEADMAALVEAEPRPGRLGPWTDFVHVSAAVGVGGAIVSGGRVVAGEHGAAGELGHVCVDPSGPACGCGSTGCLEQYVGLRAVAEVSGLPRDRVATGLAAGAAAGDPRCVAAVEQVTHALSVALASVVNVVGISAVVLGGHLAALDPATIEAIRARLDARVIGSRWKPVQVTVARGDHAAAATGAAHRALADVVARPATWV